MVSVLHIRAAAATCQGDEFVVQIGFAQYTLLGLPMGPQSGAVATQSSRVQLNLPTPCTGSLRLYCTSLYSVHVYIV